MTPKLSLSFTGLFTLLEFAAVSTASTTTPPTTTTSSATSGTYTTGLAQVAKAAGKLYFGSATDNPELSDASYVALLGNTKEFNQLTPVCSFLYSR
jgi:endo-1,4-beta-xylanase